MANSVQFKRQRRIRIMQHLAMCDQQLISDQGSKGHISYELMVRLWLNMISLRPHPK